MHSKIESLDFVVLCLFVLSQAFTVPLFTIGPSWAVWPTAGDILVAAMVLVMIAHACVGVGRIQSKTNRRILTLLLLLLAGCTFSYLILCRAMPILHPTESGRAADFGEYQLYRIAQAILAFVFASQIDLTPRRRRFLSFAAVTALTIVCTSLFLEYFGIVSASAYADHLPKSTFVAGPWGYYASAEGSFGYGTIGYNHAYSSSQVLLLLVLCLLLNPKARNFAKAGLVFLAEAAIFASGCRAVFLASLIFLIVLFVRRPRTLAAFACVLLVVAGLTAGFAPSVPGLLRPAVDRALDLNPFADTYSGGRPQRWSGQIDYLNEEPLRWLVGAGFGTAVEETDNAHMIYLQIINETGVLGLAAFVFAFWEIFRQLYRAGPDSRPMFFGTIAILTASIAQETLYPVPAMGQYIAFYTFCLALALRPARRRVRYRMVFVTDPARQRASNLAEIWPLNLNRGTVAATESPDHA